VPGVNLGDAISMAARAGVILSGGGHAMAGGLSLEPGQIEGFDRWMTAHMAAFRTEQIAARDLPIDALLSPGAVTVELADTLAALGPFGTGAPEPVFALTDVSVTGLRRIGANHLRFVAENQTGRAECIAWRAADTPLGDLLRQGRRVGLAGRLKAETWNNRRRVQLEIIDAAWL
jgi:single-stranded-DNA-specific exonuclease